MEMISEGREPAHNKHFVACPQMQFAPSMALLFKKIFSACPALESESICLPEQRHLRTPSQRAKLTRKRQYCYKKEVSCPTCSAKHSLRTWAAQQGIPPSPSPQNCSRAGCSRGRLEQMMLGELWQGCLPECCQALTV